MVGTLGFKLTHILLKFPKAPISFNFFLEFSGQFHDKSHVSKLNLFPLSVDYASSLSIKIQGKCREVECDQ
jgi:hypothetical protein